MANLKINIGDTWKDVAEIKINVGDTWKTVSAAKINIGDAWKDVLLSSGWDVSTATYDNKYYNIHDRDDNPWDIFLKSDGTKMYVLGDTTHKVTQYTLSTAWDISTATYNNYKNLSQGTRARGIFFKPDGTKMYVPQGYRVYQYTLSTAWDITTATYNNKYMNIPNEYPYAMFFKPDGTRAYLTRSESSNPIVYQYTLSTAWDISTGAYDNKYKEVGSEISTPSGLFFKPDGTKMYVSGFNLHIVYQYTLSTAWDITTATYDNKSKDVSSQTEYLRSGLFFNSYGTKMYINDGTNVYQYSVSQ